MARFHKLRVIDIMRETRDSVVVALAARPQDQAHFDFIQGQYLTFRRVFNGQEIRRSYSICVAPGEKILRVGIRKISGGCFSGWANEELRVGDTLDAMAPMGNFHSTIKPEGSRTYLGFAGGSGITPIISIIKTVLRDEPGSNVTLVYGNRSTHSIMFRGELQDLKDLYLSRFNVMHILESEAQNVDLFTGQVNAEKCDSLFSNWIQTRKADLAFICGPAPMMRAVANSLKKGGMVDEQIKFELFAHDQPGRLRQPRTQATEDGPGTSCQAVITLDGVKRVVLLSREGQSLLEAALAAKLDAPYACKSGVCSTCRAMLIEGKVEMEANHVLEDYEVRRGYVLTCQSYPLTDRIEIDYDR